MDNGTLALLIPVLAMAAVLVNVLRSPRKAVPSAADHEVAERLHALEQDVGSLRQQLSDAHERLDFAERLIARADDARRFPERR